MVEDHDHSKCKPNKITRKALEEAMEELRKDREDRDERLMRILEELRTDKKTNEILRRIGSDYDEEGVPYWEKNR